MSRKSTMICNVIHKQTAQISRTVTLNHAAHFIRGFELVGLFMDAAVDRIKDGRAELVVFGFDGFLAQ
ncbi:MAG: hypothetical protein P8X89_06750 [Reinekea sp.]